MIYDPTLPYDYAGPYDGLGPAPLPAPQIPVAPTRAISYLFTDLSGNLIADLPLTGVTFSQVLNGSGTFQGTLNVEDPRVQNANWVEATDANKTLIWVSIDGPTLAFGGIVNQAPYDSATGTVQISANDFYWYASRRLQAQDYSTTWATRAGAAQIAHRVLADALAVAGSLGIDVPTPAATPTGFQVPFTLPLSQQSTVDSVMTELATLGYQVGFDFACDVEYVAGVPVGSITISYPRRGRVAGTTGLMIDLGGPNTDFTYLKDGTAQAERVIELATTSGGFGRVGFWEDAIAAGYPLLEQTMSHSSFSNTADSEAIQTAWANDDIALYAYPTATMTVTLPLFGQGFPLGDFIMGDDVRVVAAPQSGDLPPVCPRFPDGLDFYFHITECAVTVADEGLSTMQITLGMPPSATPQAPPT